VGVSVCGTPSGECVVCVLSIIEVFPSEGMPTPTYQYRHQHALH
jgi:hypothetical protein